MRRSTFLLASATLAVAAGLALAPLASATNLDDVTVLPASGGDELPAGAADSPWRTIAGPVIEFGPYSNPDVLPEGTVFSLSLPDGYVWDAGVTDSPAVSPSPGMPEGLCELVPGALAYEGGVLTMPLSGRHDIGCRISFTALRVRALAGATPGGGDITVAWTVPGVGASSAVGGTISVAAVPAGEDETPLISPEPAPEPTTGNDLALMALVVVLVVAIGLVVAYARRRPSMPA